MNGQEKSYSAIVAAKPANEAQRCASESVEPRAEAEGNAVQQSTCRAQDRGSVSQALERQRTPGTTRGSPRRSRTAKHPV
jgi:RNA-directed DNA polymerase